MTLPNPTQRMNNSRKAAIVEAINNNTLAFETACRMYGFTSEELNSMIRLHKQYGKLGLLVTRLVHIRKREQAVKPRKKPKC